ncbi:MAG TPA: hypothetical protein VHF51_17185 [Solirubrobacteraceae bacterium]|nr:hypothetical protein [Solirubrobacteraceae bacterium]
MQLRTSLRRTASLVAATAAAVVALPGGPATAATFEPARIIAPGATLPVDFPGYREPADDRLPANHRIVAVGATIARGERAERIITVPKGFRIVTLGFAERSRIGARAENDYRGRRSVRLTLFADRNAVAAGQSGHGTIYVLARRAYLPSGSLSGTKSATERPTSLRDRTSGLSSASACSQPSPSGNG